MSAIMQTAAKPCPRYLISGRPGVGTSRAAQLEVDPVAAITATPGPSQRHLTAALAPFLTEIHLHNLDQRGLSARTHGAIAADYYGNLLRVAARADAPIAWQRAAIENYQLSAAGIASLTHSTSPDVRERAQQRLIEQFAVEDESLSALTTHVDRILNCPDSDLADALTSATDHFSHPDTVTQLLKLFRHRHTPIPPDVSVLITDRLLHTNRSSVRGELIYFLVANSALAPESLQTLLTNTPDWSLEVLDLVRGLLSADAWPHLTTEQARQLGDRDITWEPWMHLSPAMAETLLDRGPGFRYLAVKSGASSTDTINTMACDHFAGGNYNKTLARALLSSPQLTVDTIDYAFARVEAHAGTEEDRIATLQALAANPSCTTLQQQRLLTLSFTSDRWFNTISDDLAHNPNLDQKVGVTIARELNTRAAHDPSSVVINRLTTKNSLLTNPSAAAARQYLPARFYWGELDAKPFLVTELDAHLGGDPDRWAEFAVLAPEWDGGTGRLLQSIAALAAL